MIDIANCGRFGPITLNTTSAIRNAAPDLSNITPIIVPATITIPILVIKPPKPVLILSTTVNKGIPAAIPTKNELINNARKGCSFSFAVAKTMNNTPIRIIRNNISSPLLYSNLFIKSITF